MILHLSPTCLPPVSHWTLDALPACLYICLAWFYICLPLVPACPPHLKHLSTRAAWLHGATLCCVSCCCAAGAPWLSGALAPPLQRAPPWAAAFISTSTRTTPGSCGIWARIPRQKHHAWCQYLQTSLLRCEARCITWAAYEPEAMVSASNPREGQHCKRAFLRAQRHLVQESMLAAIPKERPSKGTTSQNPQHVTRLTLELWQELQDYVGVHGFDVVFLQSTGWSFSSTWSRGYAIVHCGTPGKQNGGLLMMVKHTIASAENLNFCDVVPGRIQHVRVQQLKQSHDLANVFQHPWRTGHSQDQNLEIRREFWDSLRECCAHLPFRNRLVIAGDFKTSLLNEAHADSKTSHELVKHHNLGSLPPQGNNQIDYVFGRQCQLDSNSKRGIVDSHTSLASCRQSSRLGV